MLKKQTYVHQMECFMQDLVAWRTYYGLTAFPIVPKAAFYGNVTAMLMNAGKEIRLTGMHAVHVALVVSLLIPIHL